MSADPLETLRAALSDRYRVEHLLGSGGMATVYLAHDLKHDRPVAIKVLRPELAAALGPERFLREIQIAARLNHPHILALHDSGEIEGLLYYVMPYVEGESLQDRIAREKQLPVADAIRLTREVASALAYAHGLGFIHRDIKPGNILISNGYALVADFGLARALTRARGTDLITHSGITIGTPTYMSPEQGSDDAVIDGRSDIYALGCVVYEMLVGDPPFSGSTPGAVLARHAAGRVMPIRALRPAVPVGVEGAVMRALEKVPADRYQRVEELDEALASGLSATSAGPVRWPTIGAVLAVLFAVGVILLKRDGGDARRGGLDSLRFAVLPFVQSDNAAGTAAVERMVQDALDRWTGLSVVDRFQVSEAMARRQDQVSPLTSAEAVRIARGLRAGKYLRGEVSQRGDSLSVRVELFESTAIGRKLRDRTVSLSTSLAHADSTLAALVDDLLLSSTGSGSAPSRRGGSRSLPARQAFDRGDAAIRDWDLGAADSAFAAALRFDPEYAQAALWQAQVRMWSEEAPARWTGAIETAHTGRGRLSKRDSVLAHALLTFHRGDKGAACTLWRTLTQERSDDFAGWYGLATCLRADNAVLRDPRSPSGWRFRSSYHEAVGAYKSAFRLLPSIHHAFRAGGYGRVRDLLYTSRRLRGGTAALPDTGRFYAAPSWAGDSLTFIPRPAQDVVAGLPGTTPQPEAIVRQRRIFHDVALGWASSYPESTDALEALAISLELLGDPSALDTLRRARLGAKTDAERLRVSTAMVWVTLRFSAPDDTIRLEALRALADSLLQGADSGVDPARGSLAGLAALTGRAVLAAKLIRLSEVLGAEPPPAPITTLAPALLAFSALGGPKDSILKLEREVAQGIEVGLVERDRPGARRVWLARAATLAYPDTPFASHQQMTSDGDPLLQAQAAAQAGRREDALRLFPRLVEQRRSLSPKDLSIDAVYPEARLRLFLGDTLGARGWIDPVLSSLQLRDSDRLATVNAAASMVRAMALGADLAAWAGDAVNARRWARAVSILWRNADSHLQPLVRRMVLLAE